MRRQEGGCERNGRRQVRKGMNGKMEGQQPIEIKVLQGNREARIAGSKGQTLLSVLQQQEEKLRQYGIFGCPKGHCGGRGSCGRCQVRFLSGAPLPGNADRMQFSPGELREGMRLACTGKIGRNCTVELCFPDEGKLTVVTDSILGAGQYGQIKESIMEHLGRKEEQAEREPAYFAAIDIGTTTVAMQLIDRRTGLAAASHTFLNPGRVYGADVLSRVLASISGAGESLTEALRGSLEAGIRELSRTGEPEFIVCVGNTAMEHILCGDSLEGLARAPFEPGNLSCRKMQLAGKTAILLPGVSAFVGADIVAGVYACDMPKRKELSLYLDLGTNGEMVLGNREGMFAAATAAGPAFEGNATAGVYGADMTAVVASLLRKGILDPTGLLAEPYFSQGVQEGNVFLTQKNVREFQLAKAAVRCGLEELLKQYGAGAEEVAQVFLAGGFGYYLREEDALLTGLLPKEFAGRVLSAGNAALAGAVRYGMECDETSRPDLSFLDRIKAINLAGQKGFGERYFGWLSF